MIMKTYNTVTFLVVPFMLSKETNIQDSKIWAPDGMFEGQKSDSFKKGTVFPYIQQIFETANTDNYDFQLYTLRQDYSLPVLETKLFLHTDSDQNIIPFKFANARDSFYSPKLLISLSAKVGILVIPIQINPPTNKTDFFCIGIEELHEFIRYARTTWIPSIHGENLGKPITVSDIIKDLMADFGNKYTRFNEKYALHFTFFIADTDKSTENLDKQFINITKCREQIDAPLASRDEGNKIQPLKNLYMTSSTEGTTIMAVGNITKNPYIRFFENELTEIYIWLFLLITLQRYCLIKMVSELTKLRDEIESKTSLKNSGRMMAIKAFFHILISVFFGNRDKIADELRQLIKKFSMLRINTSYHVISEDSACNDFYQLCSKSAGISELNKELEKKTKTLNEYLAQQAESRKEMMDWQLSILLAILTVTSASNDMLDLIKKLKVLDPEDRRYIILGIVFVIATISYILVIIVRTLRKK